LPYVVRIVPRGGGHPGYHPVDAKRGRTDHRTGCQGRLSPTTIPSASGRCSICWLVRPGNRLSIRVLQSASLPSILPGTVLTASLAMPMPARPSAPISRQLVLPIRWHQHGLRISVADADKLLAWANGYHDRGVLIRYEFTKTRTLPMAETLFPIVAALIEAGK